VTKAATAIAKLRSVFTSRAVTSDVNGTSVSFYPMSIRLLLECKDVIKPLAGAVTTILAQEKLIRGTKTENITQGAAGEEVGGFISRSELHAPSPEMVAAQEKTRRDAVQDAIEALFSKTNDNLLGSIFLDALTPPSERGRELPSAEDVDQLMGGLDFVVAVDMLKGVAKANAQVFGPLGAKLTTAAKAAMDRVVSNKAAEEEAQTLVPVSTAPTNG